MTVTSSARRTVLLSGGDYEVAITHDSYDIDAAQRMRFDVFNNEPGYSDSIGDAASGRDADVFDEYCDHLLVRHLKTDALVGCARVLPPPRAIAAGGWYSAGEFDLAQLDPIRGETVEMGRAVVDPAHRSGSVTAMLWAALLGYLEDGGYRYMMGCVSVPLDAPIGRGRELRGIRDLAREKYRAQWEAFPRIRVDVDGRTLDDLEPPPTLRLPALLRGYTRLGARVCGEPAFDEVFDVGDFLTVLDRTQGEARYVDRLRGAMARLKSTD
ncbi:GNAT family N-acetyltransferase [Gordonia liuliyuniae]|uniref:GNAT family N-acetyltransferase n=1 Tax=Gordonia liuliyuniae TaxID=2911517 RepID=A0ABS9IWM5_9ACTN|nr:GNAT family N-acyltransferase [Gordonia liuliyuniae]MCF8589558.1 GNAT family N-acetyltransferase [Gordonia liuliyuniae]MCF8589968.1 GNAT family N-acetyltransferase [Gordonia liuliyuniae]